MAKGTKGFTKTECPVSREDFMGKRRSITVVILEHGSEEPIAKLVVENRSFSTGSMGWSANEKVTVPIDGAAAKCQLGLNLTVIGSKDLPKP